VCAGGEALSIKVAANIINSMKFDKVRVYDCHSDVGVALIDNCFNVDQDEIFHDVFMHYVGTNSVLVSPDAGANKKTQKLSNFYRLPFIRADKSRDVNTGEINGTVVYGDCAGKTAIICDDICDGGRTFIELSKALYKSGATKVVLVVTHGIFSKGLNPLYYSGIQKIYTTNSICKEQPSVELEIISVL